MKSLNEVYKHGPVEIWYKKPGEEWSALLLGEQTPSLQTLERTHTLVGKIASQGDNLELVFVMMQGEKWSPGGEANGFILGLGLKHTSMCVGDVIKIGDQAWSVEPIGFKDISDGARVLAKTD